MDDSQNSTGSLNFWHMNDPPAGGLSRQGAAKGPIGPPSRPPDGDFDNDPFGGRFGGGPGGSPSRPPEGDPPGNPGGGRFGDGPGGPPDKPPAENPGNDPFGGRFGGGPGGPPNKSPGGDPQLIPPVGRWGDGGDDPGGPPNRYPDGNTTPASVNQTPAELAPNPPAADIANGTNTGGMAGGPGDYGTSSFNLADNMFDPSAGGTRDQLQG